MSRLINTTLLFYVLFIANASQADPALEHDYQPAQPRQQEVLEVKTETEYRFGNNSHNIQSVNKEFEKKIIDHAYQRIECSDSGETRHVFDKPLPVGWLYSQFSDASTAWRNYFDTSASEHWVLPNVHCNKNRVLTTISWMRSGKQGARQENKKMAGRFRDNTPPFYSSEFNNISGESGVFCQGWEGWLFEKDMDRNQYIDTLKNAAELFTIVNIYCHDSRVTFMHHGYAGRGDQHTEASDKPFKNVSTPSSAESSVGCSWQGWLLKDGTDGTHRNKDNKKRWNYEKYFALDQRNTSDNDKRLMHGRVINPFCSKPDADINGKVTRLRAYCFYSSKWKDKNTCSSL